MAEDDDNDKLWLLVVRLALGAIAIIVIVGSVLYLLSAYDFYEPPSVSSDSWGIAKDSPIR